MKFNVALKRHSCYDLVRIIVRNCHYSLSELRESFRDLWTSPHLKRPTDLELFQQRVMGVVTVALEAINIRL